MKHDIKRAMLCGGASLLLAFVCEQAKAQDASPGVPAATPESAPDRDSNDADADRSGDIVVTAQKRSERLADVPISITAATGEQLKSMGISDPGQLVKLVPGFSAQLSTYGTPIYSIRGIGFYDTSVGGSPAVSIYTDQVPLPFSVMARGATLDIERVEVLKGPQGTLFGQNSTGGAVNYIAAKPTQNFSAGAEIGYGRFDRTSVEGFVSGGLTPTLTGRLAFRFEGGGDWQKGYAPLYAALGTAGTPTLGRRRFYNGRATLNWEPSENLTAVFTLSAWKDDSDVQAQQFVRFVPNAALNEYTAPSYDAFSPLPETPKDARLAGWDLDVDLEQNAKFIQPALRVDYALGDVMTLTSISSYAYYDARIPNDADGTPYNDFYIDRNATINAFSQEVRLSGEAERIKWMIGANYSSETTDENQFIYNRLATPTHTGPLPIDSTLLKAHQSIKTKSGFGSLDVELTDSVVAQLSARYTKQNRDFEGCLADAGDGTLATSFGAGFGTPLVPGGCATMDSNFQLLPMVEASLNQGNFAWRASLNWKPGADSLIYANVTKGYKAGTFSNVPAVLESQAAPVTQESVLAYEMGTKVALFDRLISLDLSAFYYDYIDKQLLGSVVIPPFGNLPALVNIPKSSVKGAEVGFTIRPASGLRISGGVTYLDTEVREDPALPLDPYGVLTTYVGDPLPDTPKWHSSTDVQYDFDINESYKAYLGGSVSYRSRAQAAFGRNPDFLIDAYALVDLRAGVTSADERWRLEFWGRNVTNKFHVNGVSKVTDTLTRTVGMPATYGFTVGYRM